jgi:2-dehydro-3-deoxyphosphogluconate aldolase / (4S)-4-hydroxy-2-oxoglutarate aldolase
MSKTLELLTQYRLMAVIRLPEIQHPVELACALVAGGIRVIEFSMSTPNAVQIIGHVTDALAGENVAIGAGSIISLEQVHALQEAGADFVITPNANPDMLVLAKAGQMAVIPGAYTPSAIQNAWDEGADMVKVFPARDLGPKYIKYLLDTHPHLKLLPMGGINLNNMQDYLKAGATAVGIGRGILDLEGIAKQNWNQVAESAAEYVQATVLKKPPKWKQEARPPEYAILPLVPQNVTP